MSQCGKCSYYAPIATGGGSCRRYPPQLIFEQTPRSNHDVSGQSVQYFPWVTPNEWCGEFRARDLRASEGAPKRRAVEIPLVGSSAQAGGDGGSDSRNSMDEPKPGDIAKPGPSLSQPQAGTTRCECSNRKTIIHAGGWWCDNCHKEIPPLEMLSPSPAPQDGGARPRLLVAAKLMYASLLTYTKEQPVIPGWLVDCGRDIDRAEAELRSPAPAQAEGAVAEFWHKTADERSAEIIRLSAEVERLTREIAPLQRFKWNDEELRRQIERAETAEAALARAQKVVSVAKELSAYYEGRGISTFSVFLRPIVERLRAALRAPSGTGTTGGEG